MTAVTDIPFLSTEKTPHKTTSNSNKNLAIGPQMELYTKTDWPTDRHLAIVAREIGIEHLKRNVCGDRSLASPKFTWPQSYKLLIYDKIYVYSKGP
jgi:hypothetical protein